MKSGKSSSDETIDRTWRIRDLRRKEAEVFEAVIALRDAGRVLEVRKQVLKRYLKKHGKRIENGHEPATYRDAGLSQCAGLIETEGDKLWQ